MIASLPIAEPIESAESPTRSETLIEAPFVHRVRVRARRRALWLREMWSRGGADPAQGLAIPHAEVDRILEDPTALAQAENAFYESDPASAALAHDIHIADEAFENDARWNWLRENFSLSFAERDLLELLISIEADPLLRRVCGYLNDDAQACYATPLLAAELFGWPAGARVLLDGGLVRWKLARPIDGSAQPPGWTTGWSVDPHIVSWVTRGFGSDTALDGAVECLSPNFVTSEGVDVGTVLYPGVLAAVTEFVSALRQENHSPVEIELVAPEGAGKRVLAAQISARLGMRMISADAGRLLAGEAPGVAAERIARAVRLARVNAASLYWHSLDGIVTRPFVLADVQCGLTLFGSTKQWDAAPVDGGVRRTFLLPELSRAARTQLWKESTGSPMPESIADWNLRPAEIAAAGRAAPAGEQAAIDVCRRILYQRPGELFSPLPCPYVWDDLVVPPDLRAHLGEIAAQARLTSAVYDDWGFARLCPLGKGITALFAGPSGTGKTMAAQVLARDLGRDLYRVDLSGVVNKYIGETEKRLKQVFDACERSQTVLFFDEADALFGKRTEVKDAHDRFANIEIDYLLQRMEQFDGVAILATNRKSEIDSAFLRRIRFLVDFLAPGAAEREELWRRALAGPGTPEDGLLQAIDWKQLGERVNLTGAGIKAAALGAAFLARSRGSCIDMRCVLHAVRREMAKNGALLRTGDWDV
jgi:predicted kinase